MAKSKKSTSRKSAKQPPVKQSALKKPAAKGSKVMKSSGVKSSTSSTKGTMPNHRIFQLTTAILETVLAIPFL
ncbi:MAG: hypothetical protein V1740_07285 [Candidatus Woesearchaeota archaeon]